MQLFLGCIHWLSLCSGSLHCSTGVYGLLQSKIWLSQQSLFQALIGHTKHNFVPDHVIFRGTKFTVFALLPEFSHLFSIVDDSVIWCAQNLCLSNTVFSWATNTLWCVLLFFILTTVNIKRVTHLESLLSYSACSNMATCTFSTLLLAPLAVM